ncbi:hypothetical protein [Comamonas sp. GB3 AK4-5]|uniref:hypothetical protein n=1 Tax=Comamonas sp. GB3 AK4-5 TaxID=3231487 RepID=UPI00351EB0EB
MAADYHLEEQEERVREEHEQAIDSRAAALIVLNGTPRKEAISAATAEHNAIAESRPEHLITDAGGNIIGTVEHTPIPTPDPTQKQQAQIKAVAADLADSRY